MLMNGVNNAFTIMLFMLFCCSKYWFHANMLCNCLFVTHPFFSHMILSPVRQIESVTSLPPSYSCPLYFCGPFFNWTFCLISSAWIWKNIQTVPMILLLFLNIVFWCKIFCPFHCYVYYKTWWSICWQTIF